MPGIRPPLPLVFSTWGLAAAAGIFAGIHRTEPRRPVHSGITPSAENRAASADSAERTSSGSRAPGDAVSPQTPFELRKNAFLQLAGKAGRDGRYTPDQQLLLLRAIASFSFEEAFAVFKDLTQNQDPDHETGFVSGTLLEHLSSLDPHLAVERCEKLPNFRGLRFVLGALALADPAETLRALWKPRTIQIPFGDPENSFTSTWGKIHVWFKPVLPANTPAIPFEEIQKLALAEGKSALDAGGMEMLGIALAHSAGAAPGETLGRMRSLFEQLQNIPVPEGDKSGDRIDPNRAFQQMIAGAYHQMVATSPEAASTFFDSLSDSEKTPDLTCKEIRNRFQQQGSEAVFSLAEKINDPANQAAAAGTIWNLISNTDKPSLLDWVHALPDGPFRRGVFEAMDSETGARLPSSKDRVDFFAAKKTKAHEIQKLPLSAEEKALLLQQVAPIQAP